MYRSKCQYPCQYQLFADVFSLFGLMQVIQHRLAEMKTEICIGRAFADQCLERHAATGLDSQSASMAKYW